MQNPGIVEEKRNRKKPLANSRRARRRKRSKPAGQKRWCRKTLGFVMCVVTQYNGLRSGMARVAKFDELRLEGV